MGSRQGIPVPYHHLLLIYDVGPYLRDAFILAGKDLGVQLEARLELRKVEFGPLDLDLLLVVSGLKVADVELELALQLVKVVAASARVAFALRDGAQALVLGLGQLLLELGQLRF